ncbi:MAG: LamG-like jellyroll fold domain-containing protein [Desulfovibrio sp.]|uniref:LamG-like jellyroll fold domain-containing protein n=1 Tax=Desulfovibrio sp. 7SRBS1 TaxID=3378064 RepID=UPI003B4229C2
MQHILHFIQNLFPATAARTSQRGSVLLGAIAAMVIIGAIGAGILSVSKTSALNEIEATRRSNAAYVARSGFNYAREQIRRGENPDSLNGKTISLGSQQSFTLSVEKVDGTSQYSVTSVATLSPGAKSYTTRATYSGRVGEPSDIVDSDDGDFHDMRFVGDNIRLEDGNLTMGKLGKGNNAQSGQYQSGAAWYTGYDAGARHGKTSFKYGLRTYFEFKFAPQSTGDGFVFVARSATGDATSLDLGGDPKMGSLLGYGGPGPDDRGIPAPKLGMEFDIYDNSGTGDICRPGSRNDQLVGNSSHKTFYDHMAYVFWGEHPTSCGSNKPLIWTYDDNKHGAGTEGSHIYPQNPISESGYYYNTSASNWLKRGTTYYCREEIHRSLKPNADGTYTYLLKTWITDTPPTEDYKNVREDYKADSPTPVLTHTITLDETRHNALDKIFFGFTYGTGVETELVTVNDFKLAIRQEEPGPQLDDYVGYWPFDNYAYNPYSWRYESTPDVSGNGNDISLSGGAVPGSAHIGATLCTFYPGYWLGYALCEYPSNVLSLTDAGTVMVWVSLADNTGGTLVRKLDTLKKHLYSSRFIYSLDTDHAHWGNNSSVYFSVGNRGRIATVAVHNVPLVPAPYTLIAGTWDKNAGRMDLYILSQRAVGIYMHNSASLNFSAGAGNGELFVGENPQHGQFHGNLDELYIYNRALTEEEIKTYYHKYYPTP